MSNYKKIAILGAGQAGTSVLNNIIRTLRNHDFKPHIYIYEPSDECGPGQVYRTSLPDDFIINHETEWMGCINPELKVDDDRDFYNWVLENEERLSAKHPDFDIGSPVEHLPRAVYGEYLKRRFTQLLELADRHDIKYTIIKAKGEISEISENQLRIKYGKNNPSVLVDAAFLTTGHWLDPSQFKQSSPNFIDATFKPESFIDNQNLLKKDVAVAGSGLTAQENALALLRRGAKSVTMFSRSGKLRELRGNVRPYTPQVFTEEALEKISNSSNYYQEFLKLYKQEYEFAYQQAGIKIDWDEVYSPSNPVKTLRANVLTAKKGHEMIWRSVSWAEAIGELSYKAFLKLSDKEKKDFYDNHLSTLFNFDAPMPVKTGEELLKYIGEGKLKIQGGMLGTYENPSTGRFIVQYAIDKNTGKAIMIRSKDQQINTENILVKEEEFDYLMVAAGQGKSIKNIPEYDRMIKKGILEANSIGGLITNPYTFQVHQVLPIYSIGDPSRGTHISSSDSVYNTRRAMVAVEDCLCKLYKRIVITDMTPCESVVRSRV